MEKQQTTPMSLKYDDFVLYPCDCAKSRFDLYRTGISQKGRSKGQPNELNIGYGYRLGEAIHEIISIQVSERKDISDLKGYIDSYNTSVESVLSILK